MLSSFLTLSNMRQPEAHSLLLVTLSVLWEFLKSIHHGNMVHIKHKHLPVLRESAPDLKDSREWEDDELRSHTLWKCALGGNDTVDARAPC